MGTCQLSKGRHQMEERSIDQGEFLRRAIRSRNTTRSKFGCETPKMMMMFASLALSLSVYVSICIHTHTFMNNYTYIQKREREA